MSEWKKLGLRARKLGEALSAADPTDLAKFSYDELIAQRNCGESTVREITDYLASRGLQLRTNNSPDYWPHAIPVSERLPEDGQEALFYFHRKHKWEPGIWDGPGPKRFSCGTLGEPIEFDDSDFTHWLPMPPKPEPPETRTMYSPLRGEHKVSFEFLPPPIDDDPAADSA